MKAQDSVWLWRGVLIMSALMLFVRLDYAPFFNPDEGRYASASLEMARGFEGRAPDWVVPHLNTVPRLNKPPLIYWAAAAAIDALGANEIAGRLPSALAALGTMALVWWLANALFGARAALYGAVVWATATFPFVFARILNTDMLLCFSIALATCGVWQVIGTPAPTADNGDEKRGISNAKILSGALLAGVGMGLALLSKGPVGVAFPLAIAFVWLLAARQFGRVLGQGRVWLALVVALGIAGALAWPWLRAIDARVPHFLSRFLFEENLGRFAGGVEYHKPTPIWYYVPYLIIGLLPWSVWLLTSKTLPASTCEATESNVARALWEKRALWFVWAWAAVVVGVFSISHTKLVSYILPAFPALAILVGRAFAVRETVAESDDEHGAARPVFSASWRWAIAVSALIYIVLAVALVAYLQTGKTMPYNEGLRFGLIAGALSVAGAVALLLAWRRRRVREVFLAQWATSMVLHLALLAGAATVARYEDGGAMLKALTPYLKTSDRVALHRTFLPAGIFYVGRPIIITQFNNNSGLDETALAASPWFPRDDDNSLREWAQSPQRTFVLVRVNNDVLKNLPAGWNTIARSNDYYLLCNRPAPDGFSYHYVAPRS